MDHDYTPESKFRQAVQQAYQQQNGSSSSCSQSSLSHNQLRIDLPDGVAVIVQIHNMLCNYELPMHIDLRSVAYGSINVDYDRAKGLLRKQLRNPSCTVKIYNSGKVVIHGCKSEDDCKKASRAIGRVIQKSMGQLEQRICIRKYRVSNILAICRMPFDIRIQELSRKYRETSYEPELLVGLEWNLSEPKANLRIHTTGTVAITGATSEANIVACIKKVYPFLKEYASPRTQSSDTNTKLDNLVGQMLFDNVAPRITRRRPAQRSTTEADSPTTQRARKRPHYGRDRGDIVIGTGFYNNAIYNSDEEELEGGGGGRGMGGMMMGYDPDDSDDDQEYEDNN